MSAANKQVRKAFCSITAVLIFLSIVILPCMSSAQSGIILQNSSSIYEELSGTVVNCMLQDSDGFLWFGTQNRLYRYNGYSLKPYSFNSKITNKFASNFITSICEDNSKDIWIGTLGGGLFKLNPQTEEYVNFYYSEENHEGLCDNAVRAIFSDDSGKLWIGTQNKGLDLLDPVSGHFTHYENITEDENSLSSNTITSICKDKSGVLWIGTAGGGLNKFDSQTGRFLCFNNRGIAPDSDADNDISAICVDRSNVLWVVTGEGRLGKFDPVAGKFMNSEFKELKDFKINAVREDILGNLWIGTYGNGVKMLDRDTGGFASYCGDFSQNTSLCNYRVISLYADTSGNLWVGTEGNSVDKINVNRDFKTYKSNTDLGISFSDDVVLSVLKDKDGIVWTGTANGGVNKFDRENKRITYYENDPKDSSSISSNTVNSIYEDSSGTLWFGTIDGTLNKLEPDSGKFIHFRINNVESPNAGNNGIMRIIEDKDGILWAGAANGGLVRLDKSTGQITQFTSNPANPYNISSNHVMTIAEDSDNTLWVGTGSGLNKLDASSFIFTQYGIIEPDSNIETLNYIVNAIVNDDMVLWLATDRGLFKFDKNSGKSVFIEDSQQIVNTSIYGLIKDGKDNLWLSTANGLLKYNITSGAFRKYGFNGGLHRNQYTSGAYFKSADDEVFFGGTNGFSCFYADNIKDNTHKPPVVITDFKVFNTSTRLTDPGKVTLTHKDSVITFEFAALDYANPVKNQYAYKLEGLDADWHYSGTRNYASYTHLNGGEYILRIKASNNDGVWNEQGTQIKIVVIPPFWKRAWFIIAVLVVASVAIMVLIKIRIRSIKLKSLELERQVIERTWELNLANGQLRHADEMKSNFLSMVSHEIRTPLSSILGFTELIAEKIEKTILPNIDLNDKKVLKAAEKIRRDLNIIISEGDRLSALVNNLLNISKIESGKMEWKSEVIEISKVIEQALSVTKPIIEKAGLASYVDVEADLPKISCDRDMLTQVFINLISNAVKFTKEGYIKVCAKKSDSSILVMVEDTGVGIREEHLNKVFERFYVVDHSFGRSYGSSNIGLGLFISKQIVEKHGGKIWVESKAGKGSTFYFTIRHLMDTESL